MEQEVIHVEPVPVVENPGSEFCQLAEVFIEAMDVGENSRKTYRRALKAYFVWVCQSGLGDRLDNLNRLDILDYKAELGRTKRVSSANLYFFIVKMFYGWLEKNKVYQDITRDIKGFKKTPGHAKDSLTAEQVCSILEGFDRSTPAGTRDYAIVNLMARTGLREIEVARVRVGDIREESGVSVLWVQGKGRSEADAFVVLLPAALEPIQAWLALAGLPNEEPLFPCCSPQNRGGHMTSRSISRIAKEAMRRVGIDSDRITPHSLRHTAISLAIAGGASLTQAQAMARHSSPNTTMVYFHNVNRVKDAAERCVNF